MIDLINNIAARVEWARAPLLEKRRTRQSRLLLDAVAERAGRAQRRRDRAPRQRWNSAELSEPSARGSTPRFATAMRAHTRAAAEDPPRMRRCGLMIRHAHDEAADE